MSIQIKSPAQLAIVFRTVAQNMTRPDGILDDALLKMAIQAIAVLKRESPVFDGRFRGAWLPGVTRGGTGTVIFNDAPYAGVIERGARPHKMNAAGIDALREWIRRKGLVQVKITKGKKAGKYRRLRRAEAETDPEMERILWGIVKKIETEGQKGLFIVEKNMNRFMSFLNRALLKGMQSEFERVRS